MRQFLRAFALIVVLPTSAEAQGLVTLRPMQFEIGVRGRGVESQTSRQTTVEEWLGIRLRGGVVDPRLIGFSVTLRPRLTQARLGKLAEPTGSNGRWLGLDLQLDVLSGRPLSGTLRLSRFAFDQDGYGLYGDLASRNLFTEAAVTYANRLMPLQFRFLSETWGRPLEDGVGATALPTRLETVQLSGGNRKTSFNLQQNANRNGSRFTLRLAEVQNRQAWGKGSTLQVSASAVGQSEGAGADTRNTQVGAALHLQHLTSVWSDWSASRQTTRMGAVGSSGETYTGGLAWRVVPELTAGVSALRSTIRSLGASDRQLRVGPNAGLSVGLPLVGRLSVSGGVAHERYSGSVAEGTVFAVVGEPHALDPSGTFLLDHPDVEAGSVVVRSSSGVVYLPGADYEVTTAGGYVRIAALPGGRLQPGQAVLADYRYRPAAVPDATALWTNYSGDVQLRWFRAYHRRWRIDPSGSPSEALVAGRTQAQDHITTGLQMTVPLGRVTAVALAERQRRRNDGYAITTSSVSGGVNARMTTRTRVAVGADYLFTESVTGTVKRVGGRSQLDWNPLSTLQIGGAVTGWRAVENATIQRIRVGGAAQVIWQPGLLRAALFYTYQDWADKSYTTGVVTGQPMHFLVVELSRQF